MKTFNSFQDLTSHNNTPGTLSDITVFNSAEGFQHFLNKIKTFKRNEKHDDAQQISSSLKRHIIDAVKELAEVDDPNTRDSLKDELYSAISAYQSSDEARRDAARCLAATGDKSYAPYSNIVIEAMKRAKTPSGDYVISGLETWDDVKNSRRTRMTANDLEITEEAVPVPPVEVPVPPVEEPNIAATVTIDTPDLTPFIGIEEIGDPITIEAGGTTVTISEQPGIVETPT